MIHLLVALGWLAAPVAVPAACVLAGSPLRAGWSRRVLDRLGFVRPTVDVGAVVVHGASFGEARAVAGVVTTLRERARAHGRAAPETLRTATRGEALVTVLTGDADARLPLPVDLPWTVAAWLDRVRPRAVCIVEGDLWPFFLRGCGQRGVRVRVLGAAGRPGALRFARWFPGIARGLRWSPRDDAAAARLRVVVGADRVDAVVGDPKTLAPPTRAPSPWGARPAWIAGCTHPGEEDVVLSAWRAAPRGDALLVLAPRDVRRAAEVAGLATAHGLRCAPSAGMPVTDVHVVDRAGALAGAYAHARGAFIGGTLTSVGEGHSPAEALAAGLPVARGPHGRGPAWEQAGATVVTDVAALAAFMGRCLGPEDVSRAGGGVTGGAEPPLSHDPGKDAWSGVYADVASSVSPVERTLRPWLLPLCWPWALGVTARRWLPAPRAPVPVIAVGSLAAGGAGKTPVGAWIAATLAERSPLVVSRGYGRDPGDDVRLAGEATALGDELVMLARRGIRVASAPDRLAGILRARNVAPVGVAVLDDGWGTRSVHADLRVMVVDARWPRGGGLIPAGDRRLPLAELGRADACVALHGPLPADIDARLPARCVRARAELVPVAWVHRGMTHPLGALQGRRLVAFAGIARPAGFFRALRDLGCPPERTWALPDHARGTWTQLQALEAWRDTHTVVTTEKDAARLPADAPVWALRVELRFLEGEDALRERLAGMFARAASA